MEDLKIFSCIVNYREAYCCVRNPDFETYGESVVIRRDIVKGVSDDKQEAIEDFYINLELAEAINNSGSFIH